MPAMLDDPTSPPIYRVSGSPPYPTPYGPLPPSITPRAVTLRDRSTIATLVPFSSPSQVPESLVSYLCALLNQEIEKGDTYPMINPIAEENFGPYWFANFGAVMFLGELSAGIDDVWTMQAEMEAAGSWDWNKRCLGSFYIKPNYPGRSSHVCNGGFLVTDAARNRGVGRLMGEGYLEWAPKLGYSYSVFNLVYETNIASVRIWDALGFKRIGRVPGCGNLKSHPDALVDAIQFGRDLNGEADDYLSEERFDKIRYYLKTGQYPNGSDRAEKSRLRSAGAHYRLVAANDNDDGSGEEKLMLKDKEVISDPQKQYEIAHRTHCVAHAGINKTTASIADKYHWIRIKETVSQAIRNCAECRESSKAGGAAGSGVSVAAGGGGAATTGATNKADKGTAATGTKGRRTSEPKTRKAKEAKSNNFVADAGDVDDQESMAVFGHPQQQHQHGEMQQMGMQHQHGLQQAAVMQSLQPHQDQNHHGLHQGLHQHHQQHHHQQQQQGLHQHHQHDHNDTNLSDLQSAYPYPMPHSGPHASANDMDDEMDDDNDMPVDPRIMGFDGGAAGRQHQQQRGFFGDGDGEGVDSERDAEGDVDVDVDVDVDEGDEGAGDVGDEGEGEGEEKRGNGSQGLGDGGEGEGEEAGEGGAGDQLRMEMGGRGRGR